MRRSRRFAGIQFQQSRIEADISSAHQDEASPSAQQAMVGLSVQQAAISSSSARQSEVDPSLAQQSETGPSSRHQSEAGPSSRHQSEAGPSSEVGLSSSGQHDPPVSDDADDELHVQGNLFFILFNKILLHFLLYFTFLYFL